MGSSRPYLPPGSKSDWVPGTRPDMTGETPFVNRLQSDRSERRAGVVASAQRTGAPASIHAASVRRSSGVMSVMLPGGIAFDHTALRAIRRAFRLM